MKDEFTDFHVPRLQDGKYSFYSVWTLIAYWRTYGESPTNLFANVIQQRSSYTGVEEK